MKKIVLILIALLTSVSLFAQKDGKSLYNKYSDMKGVSAVYISPSMFRLIGNIPELNVEVSDDEYLNINPLINSLEGLYVLESENKEISSSMYGDVNTMIKKGHFELMLEAKDDGETVQIYTAGDSRHIDTVVFLCRDEGELDFICIEGTIIREDFNRAISKSLNQ